MFTLAGLLHIAFYQTCAFQHAYFGMGIFYVGQRIKYGDGERIFQAFTKKFFAV